MFRFSLPNSKEISLLTHASLLRVIAVSFLLATLAWGQSTEKILTKALIAGNGGLTFDQHGDLYGTDQKLTKFGGVYRLHALANGGWARTILYHFAGGTDGANPQPNLVFDGAGNLYGATNTGGNNNNGTVFQLTPTPSGPWIEKVLYNFELGPDGFSPSGGVIIDGAGNLYGTTFLGPTGTVYEIVRNADGTWTHKVLYTFTGGSDGSNPRTGLVLDKLGNLFGTTSSTVFELSPATNGDWTFRLLHTFCSRPKCADGTPGQGFAFITFDSHGNLYGSATQGGNSSKCTWNGGCGTVFRLLPTKTGPWVFQVLHSFCSLANCADGGSPSGGVTVDGAGNLFGTTAAGGPNRFGTVFEITHSAGAPWSEQVLYSFCVDAHCSDGQGPLGSLALDGAGNAFGTTPNIVFEITP
jgi:uncharacterized repeat protein (TIGR03803 family)